jgi:antitoxin VapB
MAMKTTKTFKSGNSVAVRLPKALGVEAGVEMTVREERGRYIVEPVESEHPGLDVDRFWGKATRLKPPLDRNLEDRPSSTGRAGRPE